MTDSPHLWREAATHIDGTPIFRNREDAEAEARVAKRVAAAFKCEIRPFGALCSVDWFAVRHERLVGVLELKTRPAPVQSVAVQLISVRKWLALHLASIGMGVPAVFVVEFSDDVRWVAMHKLPPLTAYIGGRHDRPDSPGAIEPVFYIPIPLLKKLPNE